MVPRLLDCARRLVAVKKMQDEEGQVAMDEPRGQAQRTAYDASRALQESTREAARVVNELADRGARASAALTEAHQRVLNEFMGLSMEMAQESSRLFLQLQRGVMDVAREGQAALLRSQMVWPEAFTDPLRWYRSMFQESLEGARKAYGVMNGTSEALTESVSRLQASTQHAGSQIEHALSTAASRMKEVA